MLIRRLIALTLLPGLLVDPVAAQVFAIREPAPISIFHSIFEQEAFCQRETEFLHEIVSEKQAAAARRAEGGFSRWSLNRRRFLFWVAAAAPAMGIALAQLPQGMPSGSPYTPEQKRVFTQKMQSYLNGLAQAWRQSNDPEKTRLLPYLMDMTNQINIMPPGVQNLPIDRKSV